MHAGTLGRANTSALVVVIMVLGGENRGEGRGRVGGCVLAGGGDNSRGNPSCANRSSCGGTALALGSRCLVAVSCLVLSKTYPSRTKIVRRVAMRSLNSAQVLALTAPCLVLPRVFVCYCTAHRQHRMLRMFQGKKLDRPHVISRQQGPSPSAHALECTLLASQVYVQLTIDRFDHLIILLLDASTLASERLLVTFKYLRS
jgi:hypothetical protein